MAVDITLENIASINNLSRFNTNSQRIEEAFEKVLGRTGDLPNNMETDLDMDGHDLLNVNDINAERLIINGTEIVPSSSAELGDGDRGDITIEDGDWLLNDEVVSYTNLDADLKYRIDNVKRVEDRSELAALDITDVKAAFISNELGREGTFVPRLITGLSTYEAAGRAVDTEQGFFVDSVSNVLYTWLRVNEQPNERHFGGHASRTNAQQTTALNKLFAFCVASEREARILDRHLITDTLVMPDTLAFYSDYGISGFTQIYKAFNGDMVTMGNGVRGRGLSLNGFRNSGSGFTGRGIVINAGDNDQVLTDFIISDMESYCIDFVGDGAGNNSRWERGYVQRDDITLYPIRQPESEAGTNGLRVFDKVRTGGGAFLEYRGGNMTKISGCTIAQTDGILTTAGSDVTTRSKRMMLTHSRVAGNMTFYGQEHIFHDSQCGGTVTLGADAFDCHIHDLGIRTGVAATTEVIDNSGKGTNSITIRSLPFTPVWKGTVSDPVIEDGTMVGMMSRIGRTLKLSVTITMGASTTYGSGSMYIELPYSTVVANNYSAGTMILRDANVPTTYQGYCAIEPAARGIFLFQGVPVLPVSATAPFTFAVGDTIKLEIEVTITDP